MEPGRYAGRGRGRGIRVRRSDEPATPGSTGTSFQQDRQDLVDDAPALRLASSSSQGGSPTDRPFTSVGRGRGRAKPCFPKELLEDEARTPIASPLREREDPSAPEDSDDEDDFITAFRKLHPVAKPQSEAVRGGSGGGRRGHFEVLQNYPVEPGLHLSRQDVMSPSIASSSSKSSSEEVGSEDFSDLEKSVVIKKGVHGTPVNLCANFVRLKILKDAEHSGIYEYHTYFDPPIESRKIKMRLLRNSEDNIGKVINFDGAKLYLPIKLRTKITEFTAVHPSNPTIFINITVKFVKHNTLESCVHFYNILLRKIMLTLGLVEMRRNFFDYRTIHDLPIHKLEIWPGFVTAVDLNEGGLMLCCDSSFKVLRTDTMLDVLDRFTEYNPNNFQEKFREYVLGKIVLTRYNNKNYRIDDVDWDQSPKDTFTRGIGNHAKLVTFIEYYQENHGVTIRHIDQPLLITRGSIRRQENDLTPPPKLLLVPELCYVTGLTEDITSDYRIMKDIAQHTRITPQARYAALIKFIENVNNSPEASKILKEWGLKLESATVSFEGRVIAPPTIKLNDRYEFRPPMGDFSREVTTNKIFDPIHVQNWLILYTPMDQQKAERLIRNYRTVSQPLGISYRADGLQVQVGRRGTAEDFRIALANNLKPGKTQFVIVIVPNTRDDVYRVIKVICNSEIPTPSQVIRSKTLSNERRGISVMQKVALQINCKLGGSLWCIKIPLPDKIMFIGMDVYHDPKRRHASVTAVVATLNFIHTKFYSRVIFQSTQQENISSLRPIIIDMFNAYREENGVFPDRVVVFRDGVGDGQLEATKQHEVVQMMDGMEYCGQIPKFTFCIVQKRINARIYVQSGSYMGNPDPGTVLDHTVTRRYLFDFFLVSQLIREGTVNPTHYIVLFDNADITPDMIQKFSYATSYMYYNWSGSIRVPAMCQYAHKLAGLVGQHMRIEPSKDLCKKLYFL